MISLALLRRQPFVTIDGCTWAIEKIRPQPNRNSFLFTCENSDTIKIYQKCSDKDYQVN